MLHNQLTEYWYCRNITLSIQSAKFIVCYVRRFHAAQVLLVDFSHHASEKHCLSEAKVDGASNCESGVGDIRNIDYLISMMYTWKAFVLVLMLQCVHFIQCICIDHNADPEDNRKQLHIRSFISYDSLKTNQEFASIQEHATAHVNAMDGLLDGYRLCYSWNWTLVRLIWFFTD